MQYFLVYTFYRFKNIKSIKETKFILDKYLEKRKIKGTILIASEGINGSLSGTKKDLDETIKFIKTYLKIRKFEIKINRTDFLPFNRMKVRLKKEIVSLGKGNINITRYRGELISPKNWDKIIHNKDIKVIDVRNKFEIGIGKFKDSLNPETNSFRDFPDSIKRLKIKKNDTIAMYCTGGIRCEKASAYLKLNGFKNVMQLNGGIIKYLEYKKEEKAASLWNGECFVFDERVTLNKELKRGKYLQCHGCRTPITIEDTFSKKYKKGVSCPYCFDIRSNTQKKRSSDRQIQINLAEEKGNLHPFKKISL